MNSVHEKDAALILLLQATYKGRRRTLDEKTEHVKFGTDDTADQINAVATNHNDGVQRILRQPNYSQALHTVSQLLSTYENQYAELVKSLKHIDHDHSGSEGTIHFTGHNGRSSAIKCFVGRRTSNFLSQFSALLRTEGISGTPELKAASLRDGVIVTNIVSGTPLTDFQMNGDTPYHNGHIRDYLDRIFTMSERHVRIDNNPANFLLSDKRISVVDYDDKDLERNFTSESQAAQIFHDVLPLFMRHDVKRPKGIQQRLIQAKQETHIANRILDIIESRFPRQMDILRRAFQSRERNYLFDVRYHENLIVKSAQHTSLQPLSQEICLQIKNIKSYFQHQMP